MKSFAYQKVSTLGKVFRLFDQYGERAKNLPGGTDHLIKMIIPLGSSLLAETEAIRERLFHEMIGKEKGNLREEEQQTGADH